MLIQAWEEFEKAAQALYLEHPMKAFSRLSQSSLSQGRVTEDLADLQGTLAEHWVDLQPFNRVRYSIKYTHHRGHLKVKLTDDLTCLRYETEIAQDMRKIEKFMSNLMRHMASKEQ